MASSSSETCSGLGSRRVMPALAGSSTGALPTDALREILLRLPAKDLCRLRAVCRPWRAILSDPQFAAAHAARHPGPLLIAACDEGTDSLVEIMDLSGRSLKKVPRKDGDWVVSMARDLVHVSNAGSSSSRLLNPATGAAYYFSGMKEEGTTYLFGQSGSEGRRKVVRRSDEFSQDQLIEVFTLNDSGHAMWREKPAAPLRVAFDKWSHVVIDGVAYLLSWIAFFELAMIITFDLETEEWGTFLGPNIIFLDSSVHPMPRRLTLADLDGSLAVVCLYGQAPRMDIWISTDIAMGDWVKRYSITFEQYYMLSYVHPVLLLDDQRLLIYIQDKKLLQIYNPGTNTFTDVVELEHCSSICLYTGNLLSLDC